MLHRRGERARDDQAQHALLALALGELDRFGDRDAGIAFADDLHPAADDRMLDEAEPAEARGADIGQQLGDRACAQQIGRAHV